MCLTDQSAYVPVTVCQIYSAFASQTSGIIVDLPSGVYSIDHDRSRFTHSHHSDVTLITATAGNQVYMLSNAPVKRD